MAKSVSTTATVPLRPSCLVPPPPANLATLGHLKTWKAHSLIHRLHSDGFGPNVFNGTPMGDARFSPIRMATGEIIPTLYGATSFEGAAMETVFRDVPFTTGLKTHEKAKLANISYSVLDPQNNLTLLDITGLGLRKLGVQHKDLIETERDTYPQTRVWAEACHSQIPDAQGMMWVSRQHNTTLAIVLFGDRIDTDLLAVLQVPESITIPPSGHYTNLLSLADAIDLKII